MQSAMIDPCTNRTERCSEEGAHSERINPGRSRRRHDRRGGQARKSSKYVHDGEPPISLLEASSLATGAYQLLRTLCAFSIILSSRPSSNPLTGTPTTETADGKTKQARGYGKDGYPETDVDFDHDHGQGKPHAHDWGRPPSGGPPTHNDRGPGRPVRPGDPKPRWKQH